MGGDHGPFQWLDVRLDEQDLGECVRQAAPTLAETVKQHLAAQGLPSDVVIVRTAGGAMIASPHRAVRDAELGVAGAAPRGVLEHAARTAMPEVLQAMVTILREAFR
jgi:hypothetical protein